MGRRFKQPLRRGPKTDPQQYRVYRMESEAIGCGGYVKLSQKTIRKFARVICRKYGVPQVRLKFSDLGVWAAEWSEPNLITMNPNKHGSLDLIVIAHELAHHVHNIVSMGLDQESHGPEFLCCYMSVLDTGRIIPIEGMRAIFSKYRLRFVDPGTSGSLKTLVRRVRRKR